jgi:catechol 2,3-dioxygenase-like lactoylglutathione lyase family enzyme
VGAAKDQLTCILRKGPLKKRGAHDHAFAGTLAISDQQEDSMKFHHMCIVTADLAEAIHLWRDVLGFRLETKIDLPAPGFADAALMDDSWRVKGARSKLAWLRSREGAQIELLEPISPLVQVTPPENLGYHHTGIHELALQVDDIDAMFKTVRAAGYETVTDYVWSAGDFGRSFIFYDAERNMIQLWANNQS